MRQARILSSAFLLFLLWWLLAVWMDNDFIIPYPLDVLKLMGAQLQSAAFYQSTLVTLLRSWGGLLAAFVLAGWCAFLSYRMPAFHDLFYPILLLTRSVPNISYDGSARRAVRQSSAFSSFSQRYTAVCTVVCSIWMKT